MSTTKDDILQAALQLPESDRMEIVSRLLETTPDDRLGMAIDDPEFAAELLKRSGDWDGSVPWEQLRDTLRNGE